MTKIIEAKFIGKDSLGYKNGETYLLDYQRCNIVKRKIRKWQIEIRRVNGEGYCPYTNIKKFRENWEVIK